MLERNGVVAVESNGVSIEKQDVPVAKVTLADIARITAAGLRDFLSAPQYGLALAGFFVVGGWLLVFLLWIVQLIYLIYPVAMGFALVAPFAAVGFYAVSRLLERGEAVTWSHVWAGIRQATKHDLRWMAVFTGFAFFFWVDMAAILFFTMIGANSIGPEFFSRLFTTTDGLIFLVVGNAAGAAIALAVFSVSAISFPMLFDRDVDIGTAIMTSVRLVRNNAVAMIVWCAVIAFSVAVSIATGLIGLLIVMPVVGHATWHLYRHAVAD